MLSDVGGIQGLLTSVCLAIIGVWNYNNFDSYMASRLYKIKDKKNTNFDEANLDTEVGINNS